MNSNIVLKQQISKIYLCEQRATLHFTYNTLTLSEVGLKCFGIPHSTKAPKQIQFKKHSEKTQTMHYYRDSQFWIMNCCRSLFVQRGDQVSMTKLC